MMATELNYEIGDKDILAILAEIQEWRKYLNATLAFYYGVLYL
jgi:hypothetical protein